MQQGGDVPYPVKVFRGDGECTQIGLDEGAFEVFRCHCEHSCREIDPQYLQTPTGEALTVVGWAASQVRHNTAAGQSADEAVLQLGKPVFGARRQMDLAVRISTSNAVIGLPIGIGVVQCAIAGVGHCSIMPSVAARGRYPQAHRCMFVWPSRRVNRRRCGQSAFCHRARAERGPSPLQYVQFANRSPSEMDIQVSHRSHV